MLFPLYVIVFLSFNCLRFHTLLLEVNPSILTKAFITRENSIRGETYIVPLGLDKVLTRRDSYLSKILILVHLDIMIINQQYI